MGAARLELRGLVTLCVAFACLLCAPVAVAAAAQQGYVVQLDEQPVAGYGGEVTGLDATSPRVTGQAVERTDADVRAYRRYLSAQQSEVLGALPGDVEPIHSYRFTFAGFSATLTAEQAARLRRTPGVARVWRDELREPLQAAPGVETPVSPEEAAAALGGRTGEPASYLGLPTGLWSRLGGISGAGQGVIVGVIDTGITPEHPSFAADPAAGYVGPPFQPPEVWDGACQGGERFPITACNAKLVGARYFVDGFRQTAGLAPHAVVSPRDDDGHGSHVAGSAAGNFGVDPLIQGNDLGVGVISGIAPRAHVAAYKACWDGRTASGCATSDLVAAIDAAVADGVDVINYSIGSNTPTVIGPDSVAFLFAAQAGVYVAAAAGNAGPEPSTLGSPSGVPWVTSVAASTLARTFQATATIAGGPGAAFSVTGASAAGGLAPTPLIDAHAAVAEGATAQAAELCLPGSLSRQAVAGKAVLCRRGVNARVEKSLVVRDAGGVGMVLANASAAEDVVADITWVPSIAVGSEDGERIRAAIGPGTTVEISAATAVPLRRGGMLAAFSSRGPQRLVPDVGKPDVSAPGVNILSAMSPIAEGQGAPPPGNLFQVASGTSMASPQVAGAAALLRQLHPLFTPAETRSAFMTTADPDVLLEDGRTPATVFQAGAGEIDPNAAADPGLVLDIAPSDYLRYLEGVDPDIVSGDVPPLRAIDLNLPSITGSSLVGELQVARTFRSVVDSTTRWEVEVQGLPGVRAQPSPRRFRLRPGQRQTVRVALTLESAALGSYVSGALVLTDGNRRVRVPIMLQPRAVDVREVGVEVDTSEGTRPLPVRTGFTGRLSALGWGLAAPEVTDDRSIEVTTRNPVLTKPDAGTHLYPVTVRDGAQLLSAELRDVAGTQEGTDLDLYLVRDPDGDGNLADAQLVDSSTGAASEERIRSTFPSGGRYVWVVVAWQAPTPTVSYDMARWLVDDPSPDVLEPQPALAITGDPAPARPGATVELQLAWNGLDAPQTYLGVATFHDADAPSAGNRREVAVVELRRTGPSR